MRYDSLPEPAHPFVMLREMKGDDAAPWYDYLSQPEVFENTSWDLKSAVDLVPYFAGGDPGDPSSRVRFAVVLRADGQLVGTAGFHTVSALNRSAELAYDLAPAVWGRGIASAVCESLVQWAFAHVGLMRVQATVLETNVRSMRVLARGGFEREGLLRNYRMVRGRPGNFWMYSRISPAPAAP